MVVGLSRRGFLQAGLLTSGALLGAAVLAGCVRSIPDTEPPGDAYPDVLSRRELAILAALADRVITPAAGTPTARDARVARRIDRELAFNDGSLAGDVRAALTLIEYGPFLDFHLRPFTRLSPAEQDTFLHTCAESGWTLRRNAFGGLRFLCLFFYYTDDRTWRSIGYGGTMVDRKLPEAANAREVLDQPLGSARA
ncbi:MAG: gluconate 2-dehydrogenase subunit 3 family protein [Deltaproteobacteria bacterium]|nr:gluconate 2-dehydrogenase subunit 3 family protein [Deltaproteobacteria bacterium]